MANVLDDFKNVKVEQSIDASKKVRVGIIGTGWIADAHIQAYLKQPDVEIVAGCDLIPGKADKFFENYGIEGVKTYGSHKELIDAGEVDAVCICTYNATHAECAIYALEHGVHVLLEKPFTVTVEEAIEVMKAEKKSGKILTGDTLSMRHGLNKCWRCKKNKLRSNYYLLWSFIAIANIKSSDNMAMVNRLLSNPNFSSSNNSSFFKFSPSLKLKVIIMY